jgi:gas vesicle protein
MIGILLTSCGEKSKQDATEVKDDLKELNKDLKQGAIHTAEEIKITLTEEWDKFKTASEYIIQNTEKEIKDLRERISKTSKKDRKKLNKQLDELEQRHLILKDKLAVRSKKFKENLVEFNEKAKDNQQQFKREFNRDMETLGKALKELLKDNVD